MMTAEQPHVRFSAVIMHGGDDAGLPVGSWNDYRDCLRLPGGFLITFVIGR